MGTEDVDTLIQRAQSPKSSNVNESLNLLEDAMKIALRLNYKTGIANINYEKGNSFFIQGNYKKSLTSFHEALQQYKDLDNKTGLLNCYHKISTTYFKLGDCPSALNSILESLRINSESGDDTGIASNHNELGKLYVYLQDYRKAIEHFKKALQIFESIRNKKEMVNSFFLLGNAFNWIDDYETSLYYLLRGVNSLDQVNDPDIKAKTIGSLAILYTKQKQYDLALKHFNEALSIADAGASPTLKAQLIKSLGNLYIELTQFDKAIEVLKSALEIAELSPVEAQLQKIHEFLSLAYERLNDYENSLLHYKKYVELDKQITSEEVNLKTKSLYIKYDLEELKKQKEIAELSDKMKEQFLANVSHEIRTPMNGVLGMAHLLSQTNPTPEQDEFIEAIKLSANNLMSIINDILDFSKINAGKIEFSEQEFNVRDLLKGIVQILRIKADEKNIRIGCVVDPKIPENIIGDPMRLNQIIINLLGNAVKFTEKGTIKIDIRHVDAKDRRCTLKIKVTDTGIGIPEDKLRTIFESFEQVEHNKKRYEGTGLGLTIVKQLVEMQGGAIRVTSKMNEGSEFSFELVFGLPETQPKKTEQLPSLEIVPQDFSHVNVLIVEDNKINQLLVKNMLKKFGFINFDCSENGKSALARMSERKYDIVLMDIQMPGMDGYEITTAIRTKMPEPVCSIPIIALTADASEKEKIKAREAGMNDYVVKPYTPEDLYSTMLKYLSAFGKPWTENPKKKFSARKEMTSEGKRKKGIELGFLEKYTGGDLAITVQLIELFLKEVPESIAKMENLIPLASWNEVHAVAHKVKSCISIFELNELKKIILNIEECCREVYHVENVPELFLKFESGCKEAILDLEDELRKLRQTQA